MPTDRYVKIVPIFEKAHALATSEGFEWRLCIDKCPIGRRVIVDKITTSRIFMRTEVKDGEFIEGMKSPMEFLSTTGVCYVRNLQTWRDIAFFMNLHTLYCITARKTSDDMLNLSTMADVLYRTLERVENNPLLLCPELENLWEELGDLISRCTMDEIFAQVTEQFLKQQAGLDSII